MNLVVLAGVLIFVATAYVSRSIMAKGIVTLSKAQKATLLETFTKLRKYNIMPAVVIFIIFFVLMNLFPTYSTMWLILVFTAFILSSLAIQAYTYQQMKAVDLPPTYIRSYLQATALRFTGVIVVIFVIAWMLF